MTGTGWHAGSKKIAIHMMLALGGVVMLGPFVLMVLAAFKPENQALTLGVPWSELSLHNFGVAWRESPWPRYYWNGFLAVTATFVLQLVVCLPAAYVLARKPFRGRAVVMLLVLFALLVPQQVRSIPVYLIVNEMGLIDTIAGLVVPFISSGFMIFLYRQFILSIPGDVFDAAWMDGVGSVAVLWRVVLPAVKPAVGAAAAFSVVEHWNDLFWPSLVVRSDQSATVPFAIAVLGGQEAGVRFGPLMAAACMAVAPVVVAFVLLQRHLVRGLTIRQSL